MKRLSSFHFDSLSGYSVSRSRHSLDMYWVRLCSPSGVQFAITNITTRGLLSSLGLPPFKLAKIPMRTGFTHRPHGGPPQFWVLHPLLSQQPLLQYHAVECRGMWIIPHPNFGIPYDLELGHWVDGNTLSPLKTWQFTIIFANRQSGRWQHGRRTTNLNMRKKSSDIPPHYYAAATVIKDPMGKATVLASHFASTFSSYIPRTGLSGSELSCICFNSEPNPKLLCPLLTTPREVACALDLMKIAKSPGIAHLPARFLRALS
ncbi:hypothetical protein PR048_023676 [Dryococelus australis]|uniref:Uncharacterized protein n=1 Tax=Dryococelus australis TaxID=614101 RepID=A0ABQ9GUR8_9NEOP|nr:hypothetical protein PR048_023676 [Dryococelus australis]